MGGARRFTRHADQDLSGTARIAALSVGVPAALDEARRFSTEAEPSRERDDDGRQPARTLRVARPASHGPHHVDARAPGLVTFFTILFGIDRPSAPAH